MYGVVQLRVKIRIEFISFQSVWYINKYVYMHSYVVIHYPDYGDEDNNIYQYWSIFSSIAFWS